MVYNISLITGDGIGPELSDSALSVMNTISSISKCPDLCIVELKAGDAALAQTGEALPPETLSEIRGSDACLKAPVGESAADVIVVLRRLLDLYANIRPSRSYPGTPALRDDIDMVIVRENTEDLYTGKEFTINSPNVGANAISVDDCGRAAIALRIITEKASTRIATFAFETALCRQKPDMRVTCVHKSNVMRITDGVFADACSAVSEKYPDVLFDQMYVDACAMNLIREPQKFDVIVTTNLFGDILSDESSQVVGGLGMAPAANIGDKFALFEPVHGAGFDIAGKNVANPSSFLLSVSMMLDWLGAKHNDNSCTHASSLISSAIYDLVKSGITTVDMGGSCTTSEFTKHVIDKIMTLS